MNDELTVALMTEVFFRGDGERRLHRRLAEARELGAELAVLPELPLNPWSPVSREAREEDAEPPEGPRFNVQAEAARRAGIALLGGAIVRNPETGQRHNTAFLFDGQGRLLGSYEKLHLPEEEGYWETSHYQPGEGLPEVVTGLGMPLGIQICSDVNRPELSHFLGAVGAQAILVPRATPPETYERWRLVLRANAVTSGAYVLSVNRPGEPGEPIGGPSIAVAPTGEVLLETTEPVAVVTLQRDEVLRARREYPGYLPVRAALYAQAWARLAGPDPRRIS